MDDHPYAPYSFAAVPLERLFPGLAGVDQARMAVAAAGVEAVADVDGAARRWGWWVEHGPDPAQKFGRPLVLGTELRWHPDGDVQARFEVTWAPEGCLSVDASVELACACERFHGTHDAARFEAAVGDGRTLAEAFELAAAQLVRWSEESTDPAYWAARV